MTWLHKDTKWTIKRLFTDADWNSSPTEIYWDLEGHFKKIDETDTTFDVSNIEWSAYKFTIKSEVDIKPSDRIIIREWKYIWEYSVQDFMYWDWLALKTTKILVVK